MLRDSLAGLIVPMMLNSARARHSGAPKNEIGLMPQVDRVVKRRSEAILAQDVWVKMGGRQKNTKAPAWHQMLRLIALALFEPSSQQLIGR